MRQNVTFIVGEKIRYYRILRNLTQEELAEQIGSSGSYVGRIERGEQNVKLETLEKIANALKLDVFLFFQKENVADPLQDHPWIYKSVGLLLRQSERNQQRAFRLLSEMFLD